MVNDKEVHRSKKPMDNGSEHEIEHNGTTYIVKIKVHFFGFKYTCTTGGKALKSHLERAAVGQDDLTFNVTEVQVEHLMGSEQQEGSSAKPGEKVGMYKIEVHSKQAGCVTSTSVKRYNEFVKFYQTIRMMYASTHLARNIPPPPGKSLKIATNHYSPEFLEARRVKLNEFMNRISAFPGVMSVPGLQQFLGFDMV